MFLAGVVVGSLVTLVMVALYSCLVVAGRRSSDGTNDQTR